VRDRLALTRMARMTNAPIAAIIMFHLEFDLGAHARLYMCPSVYCDHLAEQVPFAVFPHGHTFVPAYRAGA
jgi:hypothetical protein